MGTLIVIDQPPYGDWSGREALDMAFSLAAFDQPVALLFTGAAVNWLRQTQTTDGIEQKSVERNLSAAPVFGVEAMYADTTACAGYGLSPDNMLAGTILCENTSGLLQNYSHVAFAG